jgi:hypothetical protein
VSCAETLCIAEISFGTYSDFQEFAQFFPFELGWNSDGHTKLIENPNTKTVRIKLYQSKNGFPLPSQANPES